MGSAVSAAAVPVVVALHDGVIGGYLDGAYDAIRGVLLVAVGPVVGPSLLAHVEVGAVQAPPRHHPPTST